MIEDLNINPWSKTFSPGILKIICALHCTLRFVYYTPIYRFWLALEHNSQHIAVNMSKERNSTPSVVIMPMPWALEPAIFVNRPNRFITRIRLNNEVLPSHLPDPGRLKELLMPGVELRVQHSPGHNRKTDYTTHLVRFGDIWVCLNTLLPNKFTDFLISGGHLPFLRGWSVVRREITEGPSRFDFLLRKGEERLFLEVKSVTFVEDRIARFPDAVTERGARHARHLAELSGDGQPAMILFVIQRDDARVFMPMWERDPKLGHALVAAREAGVDIRAIKVAVTPENFSYLGEVRVDLTPPD